MRITRTLAAVAAAIALTAPASAVSSAQAAGKPKPRPSVPGQCEAAVVASLPKGWRVACTTIKVTDAPHASPSPSTWPAWRLTPATAVLGAGQWTGLKPRPAALKAAQIECLTMVRAAAPTGGRSHAHRAAAAGPRAAPPASGCRHGSSIPSGPRPGSQRPSRRARTRRAEPPRARNARAGSGPSYRAGRITYGTPEKRSGWWTNPAGRRPVFIDSRNSSGGGAMFVDMNAYLADPAGATALTVALAKA